MRIFPSTAAALLCLVLCSTSHAEEVVVPADLIYQIFAADDVNQELRKRPFSLDEFQGIVLDPRFANAPRTQQEIARRYLAITYPAGPVPLLQVIKEGLTSPIYEILFEATPKSLIVEVSSNWEDVLVSLSGLSADSREVFLRNLPRSWSAPAATLDIRRLLLFANDRYRQIVPFYRPNIAMGDATGKSYLLSTAGRDHLLARLLETREHVGWTLLATAATCGEEFCLTSKMGDSRASLRFRGREVWLVHSDDRVKAECQYRAVYRREYADQLEIEYAFEDCLLLSVNGEAPKESLLQDLTRVQ